MALATELCAIRDCFETAKIDHVFVGEVALNYYNVPRVVNDIELCIREAQCIEAAKRLVLTGTYTDCGWPEAKINTFTQHKTSFKRLAPTTSSSVHVILYPDSWFGLSPPQAHCVQPAAPDAVLSRQAMDLSEDRYSILSLRLPHLFALVEALCRKFTQSANYVFAMDAEQLVDGMDLDEAWCAHHLNNADSEAYQFALRLVRARSARIDPLWPDQVTCYVQDEAERLHNLRVPGRHASDFPVA